MSICSIFWMCMNGEEWCGNYSAPLGLEVAGLRNGYYYQYSAPLGLRAVVRRSYQYFGPAGAWQLASLGEAKILVARSN